MKDFTFGLRFLVAFENDEKDRAVSYMDSHELEYKVVKQGIESLIDDTYKENGDMCIIWYRGTLEDQNALINLSNGVELQAKA